MFPLRDETPPTPRRSFTRTLIVINLLVFVYELSLGPALREFFFHFALLPRHVSLALSGGAPAAAAAVPLLSSIFLHGAGST